jgi:hypothetical protein
MEETPDKTVAAKIIKDILKDKANLSLTNGGRIIKQLIYER